EEGGFFRETYRAAGSIPGDVLPDHTGPRSVSTAIYYLLTPETCSAMHRLPGDEVFHFYMGDPVEQLRLYPDGSSELVVLGTDLAAGECPQSVVRGGVWQGAVLRPGGAYALLGATMAPGFDYADYEHGDRQTLVTSHPGRADLIAARTPAADG
ncbi:MAG: cupin domain-containing protein, partial [Planctomycetota bacterium]